MGLLRRLNRDRGNGGTAVAEPIEDFTGTDEELRAEIDRLGAERGDRDAERRHVRLRHIAGMRLVDAPDRAPEFPEPGFADLPEGDPLPEFARDDVTPERLRAGILRDGCLLVRGLVDRDTALRFADEIDRAFTERERQEAGEPPTPGYYEELHAIPPYKYFEGRQWIKEGGGVLAADSPKLFVEMMEMFRGAGLPALVEGYLGEPGIVSLEKTTLRKAAPTVPGAWHQDGKFMGPVRALNLWLSLSRCGDVAPGLDIVPRRLDGLVTAQTEEAILDYQVSQAMAEEAAGDASIARPIFEPGDALFFDELFLHKTGSDPSMPNPRFAIENWFFGGSAFPKDYTPLAV
jgi:hypothetical protein